MDNIYEIYNNKALQSNELLDILVNTINDNASGMDYFTIIGVIDGLKDYIKDEMDG